MSDQPPFAGPEAEEGRSAAEPAAPGRRPEVVPDFRVTVSAGSPSLDG